MATADGYKIYFAEQRKRSESGVNPAPTIQGRVDQGSLQIIRIRPFGWEMIGSSHVCRMAKVWTPISRTILIIVLMGSPNCLAKLYMTPSILTPDQIHLPSHVLHLYA